MPFRKGQSGNPQGKAKGTLHKATRAAQELLDGEAQALTRKVVELAQGGNMAALKLCLERLLPPRKDRPITLQLPKVEAMGDVPKALGAILEAVSAGEITPGEGQAVCSMLENYRRGLELTELEARLTALEEKAK
jgi:hypothetical protein